MVVPRGAPGSGVMRVAPLAVTNAAALTLCAVLTWVYGTANAQDKGILNPEPLPPLTKVAGPGTLAKELFGRKATPSPPPVRSIGFYSKGCIAGAIALPVNGETWQVMRVSRNRNWGHPALPPIHRTTGRQGDEDWLARATHRRHVPTAWRPAGCRAYQPSGRS